MKKDRNSFFSQYGYTGFDTNSFMPPNTPNMNYQMPNFNNNQNNYTENNLESRISKLERENKLLDQRISALENQNIKVTNNTDYNFANSMYMV